MMFDTIVAQDKILNKEEYLELFPWSDVLVTGELYDFFWHYELKATPEDIWPYIKNTSKLNNALGYAPIEYEEKDGKLFGKSGEGKFAESWVEFPWEWHYPFFITRLRKYDQGFINYNVTSILMQRGQGVTHAYIYIGSVSEQRMAKKLVPGFLRPFEERYGNAFKSIDTAIENKQALFEVFQGSPVVLDEEQRKRVRSLRSGILKKGADAETVDRLVDYMQTENEYELHRLRPIELSRDWEIELDTILSTFLHCVRDGLLTMSWDIICPHCRGVRFEAQTLSQVPPKADCDICRVDFENDKENSIEITFHIHPSIKEISKALYCSAETAFKDHIKIQKVIGPGEDWRFHLRGLPRGDYRARLQDTAAEINFSVDYSLESWAKIKDEIHHFLEQNGGNDRQLIVEDIAWTDDYLRPSALFQRQDYHDFFGEEHLQTGLNLDIGAQTVAFVDIVGSTKFYETHGDGYAFSKIKKKFEVIQRIVKLNKGAIIKSLGDGLMLVFSTGLDAARAAVEIQKQATDDELSFRVSVHQGHCIAVTLTSGIDFFGQTVNFAAKLQNGLQPSEVILSSKLLRAPGVVGYLREQSILPKATKVKHPTLPEELVGFIFQA